MILHPALRKNRAKDWRTFRTGLKVDFPFYLYDLSQFILRIPAENCNWNERCRLARKSDHFRWASIRLSLSEFKERKDLGELERIFGTKTLENEILREEALQVSRRLFLYDWLLLREGYRCITHGSITCCAVFSVDKPSHRACPAGTDNAVYRLGGGMALFVGSHESKSIYCNWVQTLRGTILILRAHFDLQRM